MKVPRIFKAGVDNEQGYLMVVLDGTRTPITLVKEKNVRGLFTQDQLDTMVGMTLSEAISYLTTILINKKLKKE